MVEKTHTLAVKIDATAAKRGASELKGAVNSIKSAVRSLARDSSGAFKSLRSEAENIRVDTTSIRDAARETKALSQTAKQSADTRARVELAAAAAMRTSQSQADRLYEKLTRLGDTQGIAKLTADLAKLQTRLASASTPLDVRQARSSFADTTSEIMRTNRVLEIQERNQNIAATSAQRHASELDRLRSIYVPLFAASKQYEAELQEINRAEAAGILTSKQAARARESAASALSATSGMMDRHTASMVRNNNVTNQGVMIGHQISDVLITSQMGFQSLGTIVLQQGSQIASQLQMLRATGGSVTATLLSGFTSLINPMTLLTLLAVGVGAALAKWFFAAGEETKSFNAALGDVNNSINELRQSTQTLAGGNLRQLRREYGALNSELDAHLDRLHRAVELEAALANADMVSAIRGELTSDGNILTGDVDAVRNAFDTTNDRARALLDLMAAVESARTFEEQANAVTRLREEVESVTGGLDKAQGSARGVLVQLVRAEDGALRLVAAQNASTEANNKGAGAASNLSHTIGTAADEAARLLQNLNSVPSALAVMGKSVEGQIASINAQNRSLSLQLENGLSASAANRQVQLDDMVRHAGSTGQRVNLDQIASEQMAINRLDEAAKEQARLRKQLSEANAPAKKSGGRSKQLSEEAKAAKSASDAILDRHRALQAEARALELVGQGQYRTIEAARLHAEAEAAGVSATDAKTAAMLRQIDAANALGEAENSFQTDLRDSTKTAIESALTGEFDFTTFVNGRKSKLASRLSETITDSLFPGQTQAAQAARQAQMLQTALTQGGTNAANQIRSAMSGGASQMQLAGSNTANQIATAGGGHARTVSNSIVSAGQQHAAAVGAATSAGAAAGAAGGGGGGAEMQILMMLMGAFTGVPMASDGMTTSGIGATSHAMISPAAFRHAPHYKNGTTNTSGIPAILHDNEAVVPLTAGRKIPVDMAGMESGSGGVYAPQITNHFEIQATQQPGESSEEFAKQLATAMEERFNQAMDDRIASAARYGGILNPR